MANTRGLVMASVGGILCFAAVKGYSVTHAVHDFISGSVPSGTADNPITSASGQTPNAATSGVPDTSVSDSGGVPVSTSAAANKALAQSMAASMGWTGSEWDALNKLWTRESGFQNTVMNGSSGAYGIAQALPQTKYPIAGQDAQHGGLSSPAAQIQWGLSYIESRYGSPSAAWAHETSIGWY